MEQITQPERPPSPIHLMRCMGELAVMYANEKYREFAAMMDDALDVDFGGGDD